MSKPVSNEFNNSCSNSNQEKLKLQSLFKVNNLKEDGTKLKSPSISQDCSVLINNVFFCDLYLMEYMKCTNKFQMNSITVAVTYINKN